VSENSNSWKTFYQDALLELDPEKMPQKIDAAQNAIADRVEDGLHGRRPIGARLSGNALQTRGTTFPTWRDIRLHDRALL
jgi:hypothetical protein